MTRKETAWNNAIELYACEFDCERLLNPNQWRMCYLCKYTINHGTHCDVSGSKKCWNIDHVDGNHSNNSPKNLVAVHKKCNNNKGKTNTTQQYKDLKKQKWCEC